MTSISLLMKLRSEMNRLADPKKAIEMQAYMKSKMPYHGVQAPLRREAFKRIFAEIEFSSAQAWQKQVLYLWRKARFREERYAALVLAGHKRARSFQTPSAIAMYEEMIVTGAWWDYVDEIASHHVGFILEKHPKPMKRKMLSWSKSSDLWKRRTSILCQLGFKDRSDLDLLYACIKPSMSSKEFFLQKAIGWALRQYAWIDPAEVKRYIQQNREHLSPLSKREALKNT